MKSLVQHVLRTTKNSWDGLRQAIASEKALKIELAFFVVLGPLSFILGRTKGEKIFLFSSLILVFIVELLNTAIEKTVDRISLDYHPLSKFAKDVAGAAVGLSIGLTVVVWLYILFG